MDNLKEKHVLLVDDEEMLVEMVTLLLKDNGYTNVAIARDGLECLSVLEQLGDKVYAVLLDLGLPRMGGIEVMRHLVNVHRHIIGVVVLTGHTELMAHDHFMKMGSDRVIASNYITKPFDAQDLLIELEKTLALIDNKRRSQVAVLSNSALNTIQSVDVQLKTLIARIEAVEHRIPGFAGQLGLDVLRTILIGIFVVFVLYFGLGDFLADLLRKLK